MNKIDVIDNIGYVRYIKHWGDDLDVVNSARASFDKEVLEMNETEEKLIKYLLKHEHKSPFRHQGLTFEVYCPMMVKNQWIKHQVAGTYKEAQDGWNESSRRYVTEIPEFYMPQWREAPDNMKQGSGGFVQDSEVRREYSEKLSEIIKNGVQCYEDAMKAGLAAEQARCFLPAYAMYIRYRWTISLDGALHFLRLRKDAHSQWETQEYAKAVEYFVKQYFPVTHKAWEALY